MHGINSTYFLICGTESKYLIRCVHDREIEPESQGEKINIMGSDVLPLRGGTVAHANALYFI